MGAVDCGLAPMANWDLACSHAGGFVGRTFGLQVPFPAASAVGPVPHSPLAIGLNRLSVQDSDWPQRAVYRSLSSQQFGVPNVQGLGGAQPCDLLFLALTWTAPS